MVNKHKQTNTHTNTHTHTQTHAQHTTQTQTHTHTHKYIYTHSELEGNRFETCESEICCKGLELFPLPKTKNREQTKIEGTNKQT